MTAKVKGKMGRVSKFTALGRSPAPQYGIYVEESNHFFVVRSNEADAERIVKAVNCHDDLVEALKAVNKYLEAGYPQNMRLKEAAVVLLDKAMAKADL